MPLLRYALRLIDGEPETPDENGEWCRSEDVAVLEQRMADETARQERRAEALTARAIAAEDLAATRGEELRRSAVTINNLETCIKQVGACVRDAMPDDAAEKRALAVQALREAANALQSV